MERGAESVYACGSHALLSGPAIQRLRDSVIKEVIVSDSIPHKEIEPLEKLKTVSIAPLIAEAVRRIHFHLSVSALFD
jgi:ribose-phosphate pyrophosphokinase